MSRIKHTPDNFPNFSFSTHLLVSSPQAILTPCPTASGSSTLSPSCFATPPYMLPSVAGPAGLHWSKAP